MYCKLYIVVLSIVLAKAGGELIPSELAFPQNSGLGIYDGQNTTIEKHPYMVGVLVNNTFLCAGTIVSERWVVTLAFCVKSYSPEVSFTVIAGSSDGSTGKSYEVVKVVTHPKYDQLFDHNYACLQIKDKFQWSSKTKAIRLAKSQPKANTTMTVAGWGQTGTEEKSNGQMLQGTMQWLAPKLCEQYYSGFGFNWTDTMACTYNKGKTTLCRGDLGDPFVHKGLFYGVFEAIAKKGFCSPEAYPAVLSNIPTVSPWIKQITGAKYKDEI